MSRVFRIAVVVSHPVQYYVPLYRRLAVRPDVELRVFYTWHSGEGPVRDAGFGRDVKWDIPLRTGYEWEVVENVARAPGTHHFLGLINPGLVGRVLSWRPDMVHLTGYNFWSHLTGMIGFRRAGIPVLFRGDSHLLDEEPLWRRIIKRVVLGGVYALPSVFLSVGKANREYWRYCGVPEERICFCPHSVDVERFSEPDCELEREALEWRRRMGISEGDLVLLFAGKLVARKRPLELMRAVRDLEGVVLVVVGEGELEAQVQAELEECPVRYRWLPFQNQSRMPVVYRLGDVMVLPSAFGETWGLAVNEAQACGRPVLVSDAVGCAQDLVEEGLGGLVFERENWVQLRTRVEEMRAGRWVADRAEIQRRAKSYSIEATEEALMEAVRKVRPPE
jgi:glycosyltransferase involved in cell wall biosynthesis